MGIVPLHMHWGNQQKPHHRLGALVHVCNPNCAGNVCNPNCAGSRGRRTEVGQKKTTRTYLKKTQKLKVKVQG
jgi:hypothetical protein